MSEYKLVPVEPTPEMLEAGADWCGQGLGTDEAKGRAVTAYKAMLAAAPDHIADTRKMVATAAQGVGPGPLPAPGVTQLVEALTELCDEIDKHDIHSAISKTSISWFKRKARKAIAAHRKQETSHENQ